MREFLNNYHLEIIYKLRYEIISISSYFIVGLIFFLIITLFENKSQGDINEKDLKSNFVCSFFWPLTLSIMTVIIFFKEGGVIEKHITPITKRMRKFKINFFEYLVNSFLYKINSARKKINNLKISKIEKEIGKLK